MTTMFLIVVGLLAGASILLLAGYWLLNFAVRRHLKPRYTVFGENLQVTSEWQELQGTKPAVRRGEQQHIFLKIPEYRHDIRERDFNIKLIDGRTIVPEVQVIDSAEQVFESRDGARFGNVIALTVTPSLPDRSEPVTMRLRSLEPFHCKAIGFHTKRLK